MHLADNSPKLALGRLADVRRDCLQGLIEAVSSLQGGGERVEDLGQLLLKCPVAPPAARRQHEPRGCDPAGAKKKRDADARHGHADEEGGDAGSDRQTNDRTEGDIDPGACNHRAKVAVDPQPADDRLSQRICTRRTRHTRSFGAAIADDVWLELTLHRDAPRSKQREYQTQHNHADE